MDEMTIDEKMAVKKRRDYFAGMALQGMLANTNVKTISPTATAAMVRACADALIRELHEKPFTF